MISRKILKTQEIRATLERYWEYTKALDLVRLHEIYHDDVVVEFPQSGERILGKQNIYELRAHYPAKLTFKILRIRGEGNLWITELIITYDGCPVYVVTVMEFRNGKVAHETQYYADPFEPPEISMGRDNPLTTERTKKYSGVALSMFLIPYIILYLISNRG